MGASCSRCCFPCSPEEKIPIHPRAAAPIPSSTNVQVSQTSSTPVLTEQIPEEFIKYFRRPRASMRITVLSQQDMYGMIEHAKKLSFDEDIYANFVEKLGIQPTSSTFVRLTCKQLELLLKCFTFETNKEELIKICTPHLVDLDMNKDILISTLDFEVRRREMTRFFTLYLSNKDKI